MPIRSLHAPALAAGVLWSTAAFAADATMADDICPADADPCIVSSRVVVERSASIDFGLRTVTIADHGKIVFAGFSQLSCGGLVVEPGGTLDISGRTDAFDGARLDLSIQGRCLDAPSVACDDSTDCPGSECSGGDFTMMGSVYARARTPAWLAATVAGDATIDGRLDFSARSGGFSQGGVLDIDTGGSVELRGEVRGRGHGLEGGGAFVRLHADVDVRVIDAEIDVRGQDYDGGGILLDAGNDATFSGEFLASSRAGAGSGGYFAIVAGRDVTIDGRSGGEPTVIEMNGHQSSAGFFMGGFPGDGGELEALAGRDLLMTGSVSVSMEGGRTGFGGEAILEAGRDTMLNAALNVSTSGPGSGGGEITIEGGTGVTAIGPLATILHDGERYGGDLVLTSVGPADVQGTISSTSDGTSPGTVSINSESDVSVSGTLKTLAHPTTYQPFAAFGVSGCNVSFSDALLSMDANGWGITVVAREAMLVDATSSLVAPGSVSFFDIYYRDPLQPPSLLGTISPSPNLVLDETLLACP